MSDSPDFSGMDGGEEQDAADIVRDVVARYNALLMEEHRRPMQDKELVALLKFKRAEALADQERLAGADPEEAERIAGLYATLLKELKES
ncbi:hypothetical protein [Streptomyces sp. NPDC048659]|uniref:hypothetical protein n=1 Tax=Streptomyces sp. NPDC048659 TaxID=3155489 RepID=UPI00344762C5